MTRPASKSVRSAPARSRRAAATHPKGSPKQGAWTQLRNSDRVRWSRVLSAQARMAVGYYDREEVREFLVDAVLEELSRH